MENFKMNLWVVSILFIVVYGRLVVGGEDETAKITKTNHSITTERKIFHTVPQI